MKMPSDTEEDCPQIAEWNNGRAFAVSDIQPPSTMHREEINQETSDIDFLSPADPKVTLAIAREALSAIDANCGYDDWTKCLRALKHQFSPEHDEEAYQLFDEWSGEGSTYDGPDATRQKWDSFKPSPAGRSPITIGTLLKMAREGGWPGVPVKAAANSLDYSAAVLTAPQLAAMDIPEREKLLGEWLRDGDIGFIFAPRGVGKSWIALLLGMSLARGECLGEWSAGAIREVLYVDGEMMLADTQWRQKAIGAAPEGFRWLHHEHLSRVSGRTLNLADPKCQEAVAKLLPDGSVLFLDNLSALCRGMEENGNDDWELMLDWLLALRRRKITVIIIHHAGRNGQMRGASRREDHADWVLSLKDDTQEDDERKKCIVSTFAKARGCAPRATLPLRWTLEVTAEKLTYTCQPYAGPDALLAVICEGIDSPKACAEAIGAPPQSVSRWAKKLEGQGLIAIRGRKYVPCFVGGGADEF